MGVACINTHTFLGLQCHLQSNERCGQQLIALHQRIQLKNVVIFINLKNPHIQQMFYESSSPHFIDHIQ